MRTKHRQDQTSMCMYDVFNAISVVSIALLMLVNTKTLVEKYGYKYSIMRYVMTTEARRSQPRGERVITGAHIYLLQEDLKTNQ